MPKFSLLEIVLAGGAVFLAGSYWMSHKKTTQNSLGRPPNIGDGVRKGQRFEVVNPGTPGAQFFVALGDATPGPVQVGQATASFIRAAHELTGATIDVDTRFVTRIL